MLSRRSHLGPHHPNTALHRVRQRPHRLLLHQHCHRRNHALPAAAQALGAQNQHGEEDPASGHFLARIVVRRTLPILASSLIASYSSLRSTNKLQLTSPPPPP